MPCQQNKIHLKCLRNTKSLDVALFECGRVYVCMKMRYIINVRQRGLLFVTKIDPVKCYREDL